MIKAIKERRAKKYRAGNLSHEYMLHDAMMDIDTLISEVERLRPLVWPKCHRCGEEFYATRTTLCKECGAET